MSKQIPYILLTIIIFCYLISTNLFSQIIPYWEILYKSNHPLIINRYNPVQLRAYNQNIFGFISGTYQPSESHMLLTNDGGKTWFNSIESTPQKGFSCEFVDWTFINDKLIYCLADTLFMDTTSSFDEVSSFKNMILKSTNGGITWVKKIITDSNYQNRSGAFCMADSNIGIAIQKAKDVSSSDLIWYTNDGWNTWKLIPSHPDIFLANKVFINSKSEIIIKSYYKDLFFTKDLGKTWEKKGQPSIFQNCYSFNTDFKFLNDSIYFFIGLPNSGNYKFVAKTKDAGNTWEKVFETNAIDTSIVNLSIYNDSIYYLNGNYLFFTSNNGKSYLVENIIIFEIVYLTDNYRLGLEAPLVYLYRGNHTLKSPEFTLPDPYLRYNQPLDFTIAWTKIIGGDKYHLQVVEKNGVDDGDPPGGFNFDSTLFVDAPNLIDTSFRLTGTNYHKLYGMKINSSNDSMTSQWSFTYHQTQIPSYIIENNLKTNEINTYPNPVSDYLNLNFGTNYSAEIKIYNGLCVPVFEKSIISSGVTPDETLKIDTRDYPSGVYFCQIKAGCYTETKKFVVVR